MLKKYESSLALAQRFCDALCVCLSWFIAYQLRFKYFSDAQSGLDFLFLKLAPLLVLLTLYSFFKHKLYRSLRFSSKIYEISAIFYANSIAVISFIVILYFFAEDRLSRLTLIFYFIISTFILTLMRICVRNYLRYLRKKGKNLRHVLLVGDGMGLHDYIHTVLKFKDSGIRFIGWIESGQKAIDFNIIDFNIKEICKTVKQAKEIYRPDFIVIGFQSKNFYRIDDILKENYDDIIPIQVIPEITYSLIGHQIEDFAGIPLLNINRAKLSGLNHLVKRTFDTTLCLVGLLIISPLLLIITFFIKITSKGPVFYGQDRMGLDGLSFKMWKFRSMKMAVANEDQTTWTTSKDPRVTKVGSILRKTSLDELPQLWNVIKGDMSLVGPRPERPHFVSQFKADIPGYMLRHKMKAGITGWAQINGLRGDTSIAKRIEFDNYYIKHWSFWFDIKIIFLTFWKGFINKNAY